MTINHLFDTIEIEFGIHGNLLLVVNNIYMYRRSKESRILFPNGGSIKRISELQDVELVQFMEANDDNMLNHNDDESYDEQEIEDFSEDSAASIT